MKREAGRLWRRPVGGALLAACSGGATAPIGETLNLELSSPSGDDGAVLFTITGGPVQSIDGSGYVIFSARPDANRVRVIMTGRLSPGIIARIRIPDRDQASRYSVTIDQVSSLAHLEREPAGYALHLTE